MPEQNRYQELELKKELVSPFRILFTLRVLAEPIIKIILARFNLAISGVLTQNEFFLSQKL